MYTLEEEQRKTLLAYLSKRTYIVVASLIAMLASLKNKNNTATPKK